MNVLRIDHVALAVTNLEEAEDNFVNKLGARKLLTVTRKDSKYTVTYLKWGESTLTLVRPDDPSCFVQKKKKKKGIGLHHMGIEVDDLDAAEADFIAAGGKVGPKETIEKVRREFVVAPKNNQGLLLQVMEFFEPYKDQPGPERYAKLADNGLLNK